MSWRCRRGRALVRERSGDVLAANAADFGGRRGRLDAGLLDRLRLDDGGSRRIAVSAAATAALPPLEREIALVALDNGLEISERRIPIGVVGANFEARPNVALDVAAQLLKSLQHRVLRTGGAALRTVTVLVDEVLRPALEEAGLPPAAVGLVRTPDREGARGARHPAALIPLVILRGSGATTAALTRLAAEHGVRTLAHAEGGGVLYVHAGPTGRRRSRSREASLDRLGVCNRLNLCARRPRRGSTVPELARALPPARPRGARNRARDALDGVAPLDERIGHEWANDAERVATVTVDVVDDLDDALRIANDETSGLAATIVTEDEAAAQRFLDGYRGTAAFWHAPTRFTDGFALTGAPETGINVDRTPGPARPGHLPRPLASPVPRRRRRDPAPMSASSSSSARASSSTGAGGFAARCSRARAA